MRIGLLGGSFNPVHNNHLEIAENLLNKKVVDKVWFVPCSIHPFSKTFESNEHRLNMIKYAIEDRENIELCTIETDSKEISYTAKTLKLLQEQYPEHTFLFLIGSDLLVDLPKWDDFTYLSQNAKFIIHQRKGYPLVNISDIKIEAIMHEDITTISSTLVRTMASQHKPLKDLVPQAVEDYIYRERLYEPLYKNPAATADIIVEYENKGIVLIKRKHEPFKDFWAFPGGFIKCDEESLEEAASRELREETGLIAEPKDMRLLMVLSSPKRDPRCHVITHVYTPNHVRGILKASDDAASIDTFKILPLNLAFDHYDIYIKYLANLAV